MENVETHATITGSRWEHTMLRALVMSDLASLTPTNPTRIPTRYLTPIALMPIVQNESN